MICIAGAAGAKRDGELSAMDSSYYAARFALSGLTREAARYTATVSAENRIVNSYDGITKDGQSLAYLNNLRTTTFASRAGSPSMSWRPKRAGETKTGM